MAKKVASGAEFDDEKKQKAEEQFRQSAEHISKDDLGDAAKSGHEKFEKLKSKKPGALEDAWEDLKTLISMISDYVSGDYRDIPWTSIAMIGTAVAYFVSPIDLIPDFIPVAGYVDDAFVITLSAKAVKDDIEKYRLWKAAQAH